MNKAKGPAIGFDIDRTVYQKDPGLEEAIFKAKVEVASDRYGWENTPIYYSTQVENLMSENPEGYKDFTHSIDRIAVSRGCQSYLKPDKELQRMFHSLEKYDLFVLSNGDYDHIINVLNSLGVDPGIFDLIIDRNELEYVEAGPKFKGNVKPFEHARKKLKRASKRIVYVGDDEKCDAEGKNIGMKTVLTWRPKTKESDKKLVDWETKSIYDVPLVVRRLL